MRLFRPTRRPATPILAASLLALASCQSDDAGTSTSAMTAGGTAGTDGSGGATAGSTGGGATAGSGGTTAGGSGTAGDTGNAGDWCNGPNEEIFRAQQMQDFQIDEAQTDQYWCIGLTVTTEGLRHVTGFRAVIDNPFIVHHMILYRVDAEDPSDAPFPCSNIPDSGFRYGWAPGMEDYDLPPEAGFLLGDADGDAQTPGAQTFYLLEIHYNIPDVQNPPPDTTDNSAIEICTTTQLRPNNAGALTLGDFELNIPPGVPAHEEIGVCSETSTGLLPWAINVFAAFPHMHLLGRQIWTDHLRGGTSQGFIGDDLEFDFNLQKLHLEDAVIEPGDRLETHCVFDSTERDTPTGFGEGTLDEMCLNFLYYWPVLPQEIPPCVQ